MLQKYTQGKIKEMNNSGCGTCRESPYISAKATKCQTEAGWYWLVCAIAVGAFAYSL
jgi:hypothetical protein